MSFDDYSKGYNRPGNVAAHVGSPTSRGENVIKKYNNLSLLLGAPGLLLQIYGQVAAKPPMLGLGSILLIVGLGYYAKAKGRAFAWGLFGLASIIGVIVLACLKDRGGSARDQNG